MGLQAFKNKLYLTFIDLVKDAIVLLLYNEVLS